MNERLSQTNREAEVASSVRANRCPLTQWRTTLMCDRIRFRASTLPRAVLAVAVVLAALPAAVPCLAQEQSGTSERGSSNKAKPNILVIMGDDIGIWNLSCYHQGMMGYDTPQHRSAGHGRRPVHELLRPAELHGRAVGLHYRPASVPHRAEQGRAARSRPGPPQGRPDHCRVAQAAWDT